MKFNTILSFSIAALLAVGMSFPAKAERVCEVTDPTGTPLNVRNSPNGRIVNALRNGREVYIIEIAYDGKNRPWAKVGGYYQGEYRIWGWVFREFISCYDRSSASLTQQGVQFISPESRPNTFISEFLQEKLREFDALTLGANYIYNFIDLNGDNTPEIIVHAVGQIFCGTGGCSTFILRQNSQGYYEQLSEIGISHPPILVTNETRQGWKSLIVHSRNSEVFWVHFNGREYQGSYGNRLARMPSVSGKMLFAREYRDYIQDLFPVR